MTPFKIIFFCHLLGVCERGALQKISLFCNDRCSINKKKRIVEFILGCLH